MPAHETTQVCFYTFQLQSSLWTDADFCQADLVAATQEDNITAEPSPILRQSSRSRLATRSPSPHPEALKSAATSVEDAEAPKRRNGKAAAVASPLVAPQRRSQRGTSVQPPESQTPLRSSAIQKARAASQDSALKKAAVASPSSSSRPVRASRMLSLSQIDEKSTRKINGTPRSSQLASSQTTSATAKGGKKAWLAKGDDGDDDSADEESTPRRGAKGLWG